MSFKDEVRTDFHNETFSPEKIPSKKHLINLIDSCYRRCKSYCPKVLLKYSQYIVRDKTMKDM